VSLSAYQLSAVPGKKVLRSLPDAGGIGEQSKAYGATLSLILQDPSKGEEKTKKRDGELDALCSGVIEGWDAICHIDRGEIHERHSERELSQKKDPSSRSYGPRKMTAVLWVLAKRQWSGCRQR
jgi:hypothetical protein